MPRYWALIPAAGGGRRMGGALAKQYLPLHGRSVLEWSVQVFLDLDWIEGVVVVLADDDELFKTLPLSRDPRVRACAGGALRAQSVLAGLEHIAVLAQAAGQTPGQLPGQIPERTWVLVHDAARPCVHPDEITMLRDLASDADGGLLAQPVVDTLKQADDERAVVTVDRSVLWRAQTPQMFRLDLLLKALARAAPQMEGITDEASAMEACGARPRLVRGADANLKITYPGDLALAGFWLAQRTGGPK